MSIKVEPQAETMTPDRVDSLDSTPIAQRRHESGAASGSNHKPKKRKKKLGTQVTMWIRRIHLYSGLFMLPWVLLYGFTALLFNHPTYMSGSATQIEHFHLDPDQLQQLPSAADLAKRVVDSTQKQMEAGDDAPVVELVDPENAIFTRYASGSVESDDQSATVIVDLNSGKGYVRSREKESTTDEKEGKPSLDRGLKVAIETNPTTQFKDGISELLDSQELDAGKFAMRGFPNLEFDAMVDGERKRMRYSSQSRGRRGAASSSEGKSSGYTGSLSVVGANPRPMSARSYLLRLHMAHGYPLQKNTRWFWAIAVDLMFASMVFWGLSGVVMWWQIKRTRRIGFVVLIASLIAAAWLAIGMHWQLVNG